MTRQERRLEERDKRIRTACKEFGATDWIIQRQNIFHTNSGMGIQYTHLIYVDGQELLFHETGNEGKGFIQRIHPHYKVLPDCNKGGTCMVDESGLYWWVVKKEKGKFYHKLMSKGEIAAYNMLRIYGELADEIKIEEEEMVGYGIN